MLLTLKNIHDSSQQNKDQVSLATIKCPGRMLAKKAP